MQTIRTLAFLFLFTIVALLGNAAYASENALSYIPDDSEIVVVANVKTVTDSQLFKTLWDRHFGDEQSQTQMDAFKNLTGVDPFKDINSVAFGGQIDRDESIILVVEGKFPTDKLVSLISFNPQYKTSTIEGYKVHSWNDGGEHFAAELPTGGLIVCQVSSQLTEALNAHKNRPDSFLSTSEGEELLGLTKNNAVAAAIYHPRESIELGEMAQNVKMKSCLIKMDLRSDDVFASADIRMESEQFARDGKEMLEGLIALGRIQSQEPMLNNLARDTKVFAGENSNSVIVETKVSNTIIIDLIEDNVF